jgi:hypothetical protein
MTRAWRDRIRRAAAGLRATSPRARGLAAGLALLALTSIWFFTATDAQGRTARLTADAWYYHAYLPSLALDGDLDFDNQYEVTKNWYRFGKTEIGRTANVFGIGPALFEAPAFLVGHAAARIGGANADGFSRPEVLAALYMSLIASLAALVPAMLLLRRRLGGSLSPFAVPVLLAAAGPVVYYAIRQPGYAHPFAALWVAWLVERWDASFDGRAEPRSLGTWAVFGLLVGAGALARPQCALWAVILLAAAADDVRRVAAALSPEQRSIATWKQVTIAVLARLAPRWLAGALLSLLVFAPQMLAWKALHGAFVVSPQGPGFMWWGEPAWTEVLFSSRNGLLPWAPIHALAALGLLVAAVRTPRVGLALLAGVLLQVWAGGAAWDWWAGGSFGGRRFDSAFVAFAYGLGGLVIWPRIWRERGWRRRAAQVAVGALLVVGVLLAAGNLSFASRQSGPTVRIHGGDPASRILDRQIGGPLGAIVSRASSLSNLPARLCFAWRHGTRLDAYDHLVGVHQLGELYPGLNSFRGKTREILRLDRATSRRAIGLVPGRLPGTTELAGDRARILLGFNRRDPITLSLRASAAGGQSGPLELWFDGDRIASSPLASSPTDIRGVAPRARRGTNVLEIRAAPGTALHSLELRATQDPAALAR